MVFVSTRDGGDNDIFSISEYRNQLQNLIGDSSASDTGPAWSPDGNKIAFLSTRNGERDIYILDLINSEVTRLTYFENFPYPIRPPQRLLWSPDGTKLSFVLYLDQNEIFTVNIDGTDLSNLTLNPSNDSFPTWSPDSSKIAFSSNRDGNYEIYVMNSDGSSKVNLTQDPAGDFHPTWSPSGQEIAFTPDRNGPHSIFMMNADGSFPFELTTKLNDCFPTWSPDGEKILFHSDGNLYFFDLETERIILLANDFIYLFAKWSSDGSKIAYVSDRNGNKEIFLVIVDGSGEINLTNDPADDLSPDWRP